MRRLVSVGLSLVNHRHSNVAIEGWMENTNLVGLFTDAVKRPRTFDRTAEFFRQMSQALFTACEGGLKDFLGFLNMHSNAEGERVTRATHTSNCVSRLLMSLVAALARSSSLYRGVRSVR
jgi:hypothetical protein